MRYVNKIDNKRMWSIISKYIPQQKFRIDRKSSEMLDSLWRSSKWYDSVSISKTPSDLFFSQTVPINDVLYTYKSDDGSEINYRVIIFNSYYKSIKYSKKIDRSLITVGVFIFYTKNEEWYIPINITIGEDEISTDKIRIGYKNSLKNRKDLKDFDVEKFFEDGMKIWYGIMIYILHPKTVKVNGKLKHHSGNSKETRLLTEEEIDILNDSRYGKIVDDYKAEGISIELIKSNPHISTYIEDITSEYWTEEEINEAINKSLMFGRKNMHRRTAIWPVIGYWRWNRDKDGNPTYRSFVKPHWRGPLSKKMNAKVRIKDITVDTNLADFDHDYKLNND